MTPEARIAVLEEKLRVANDHIATLRTLIKNRDRAIREARASLRVIDTS
jgi:uncharacterized coiled-coil protein SlyX